jgi:hypothetical protein
VKITDTKQLKKGLWASGCCYRDLYQIATDDQIQIIIEDWDEGISHDVWETKREALLDIRKEFDDPRDLASIDSMIAHIDEGSI